MSVWEMVFGEFSATNFAISGSWIFAFFAGFVFQWTRPANFVWMHFLAHRLLAFLLVVFQSESVCDIRSLDV